MLCSKLIYIFSSLSYITNIASCAPIDKNSITSTNKVLPVGSESLFGGYDLSDLSKYLLIPNWFNAWDNLEVIGAAFNHLTIEKESLKDMTSL